MKKNLLKICVSISIILMVIFSIMTIKLLSNEKANTTAKTIKNAILIAEMIFFIKYSPITHSYGIRQSFRRIRK